MPPKATTRATSYETRHVRGAPQDERTCKTRGMLNMHKHPTIADGVLYYTLKGYIRPSNYWSGTQNKIRLQIP